MSNDYDYLSEKFLEAMNDIGRYGHEKYGIDSFQHRMRLKERSRWMDRVGSLEIMDHAHQHFQMHLAGEPHDYFNTRKHQLAAVAFNAMMEFYLSGLDEE
jgi:hypothetical protein